MPDTQGRPRAVVDRAQHLENGAPSPVVDGWCAVVNHRGVGAAEKNAVDEISTTGVQSPNGRQEAPSALCGSDRKVSSCVIIHFRAERAERLRTTVENSEKRIDV